MIAMHSFSLGDIVHPFHRLGLHFLALLIAASGAVAADGLHHAGMPVRKPGPEFGSELTAESLGIGPTMDVATDGRYAYAVGKGELRALDLETGGKPRVVGRLKDMGNTRQIEVQDGFAFVTAREEGLFVVDVRDPHKPRVAARYDTAELATAIAVSGEIAAVGSRFAGVELLDVKDPSHPRHLATIRVGEVQSLVFKDSWLFAGCWSEKIVAVIDLRDLRRPRLAASIPLDGNGDGLDIRGNLLAAATGHHARKKGRPAPGDEAFGHGHGVEFFDISSPETPCRLAGLKFPAFYRIGMDMWGLKLTDDHAYVNDTHNGLFVIDIRSPKSPKAAGWVQLRPTGGDPGPASGLALTKGAILIAGAFDDLHKAPYVHANETKTSGARLKAPAPENESARHQHSCYCFEGSAHALASWQDDELLLAGGSGGLYVIRHDDKGLKGIFRLPTKGFARDVVSHGDKAYVAECDGGLSACRREPDGSLARIGNYSDEKGRSITQVVLADQGRIAFLAVGTNTLQVLRLHPDGRFEKILEETPKSGLFYRDAISEATPDGKRVLVQWHTTGLHEFIAENGEVRRSGWTYAQPMDTECGATPFEDGWIATSRSGPFRVKSGEEKPFEERLIKGSDNLRLPGKPSMAGRHLYIADPFQGDITALELSSQGLVRLLAKTKVTGHPGRVLIHRGKALIPAGRDGLIIWDYPSQPRTSGHKVGPSFFACPELVEFLTKQSSFPPK